MKPDVYLEVEYQSGTEKYSQTVIHFPDHQSQPRLIAISKITFALLFDSIENTHVTITLSDHDGYLTNKLKGDDRFITGKTVRIRTKTKILFTGMVASFPEKTGRNIELKIDIFSYIKKIVNTVITADDFQNAPESNLGKYGNFIYGHANEQPGLFKAHQINTNLYLAAWNNMSQITEVEGNSIPSQNWYIDGNGYTLFNHTSTKETLTFTGLGPGNQDSLIDNPARMLNQFLIDTNSPVQIENLEEAASIFQSRRYNQNALFVTGKKSLKDVFTHFQNSYNCFLSITREAKVTIQPIKFSNLTVKNKVHPTQIKNFKKYRETKHLKKTWKRNYLFSSAENTYLRTPLDVSTSQEWTESTGEFNQQYLMADAASLNVASRYAFLFSSPLLISTLSLHHTLSNQLSPGDIIEFKHPEAFYPAEYRKLLIMRIEEMLPKTAFSSIEGFDLSQKEGEQWIIYPTGDPRGQYIHEAGNPNNPIVFYGD